MKQFIWDYLGLGSAQPAEKKPTSRALPASWYRSRNLYELERRAIFSKRWLLVTHKLRFAKAGDWVRFKEAGFEFFIARDREGDIKAFHNICRHRGFPLVTEERGNAKILSCKYHSWSYGLNGKLSKAPGYRDVDFDTSSNSLLPIHLHIDDKGFIWINLDAHEKPEIPWSQDFEGVDMQSRFEKFDFENFQFDHTWNMSGNYNWKTLADNYNECYHCATAHPDTRDFSDLSKYRVDTKDGHIQHFAVPKEGQSTTRIDIASTFYFPNACMTVAPDYFYLMRCVPTAENHCSMEYEVFKHKNAKDTDFEKVDQEFKRILSEDKWLCDNVQKNLEAKVFVNGEMHPRMEKGPLFFQSKVREIVQSHRQLEEAAGSELWPAQQMLPANAGQSKDDEDFCQRLDCISDADTCKW